MNEHVQTASSAPLFNPLSPEFIRDPYPHYARLRSTDLLAGIVEAELGTVPRALAIAGIDRAALSSRARMSA